ncbi:hypothetical protein H5410_012165 [Solanum commersonii]|uniref:Uncharacterized protein n=1 Tax=Solanum commersonii TaxID=4109 RepID=A0A9J6ARN6_SOLCO|nr:hypothetical protein H5410_012165 [Solanum commersonii]
MAVFLTEEQAQGDIISTVEQHPTYEFQHFRVTRQGKNPAICMMFEDISVDIETPQGPNWTLKTVSPCKAKNKVTLKRFREERRKREEKDHA